MALPIVRAFTALNGGSTGALDSVSGALLQTGELAIVNYNGNIYFYKYNASSGQTESSPYYITPDTSAGSGAWELQGITAYVEETVFVPASHMIAGATSPSSANVTIASSLGKVVGHKFSGSADQDVVIPWWIPEDVLAADGLKFRVEGIVTAATGLASSAVVFGLSGFAIDDDETASGTLGTQVTVTKTGGGVGTFAQYDRVVSAQSSQVTVTNFAAGKLAFLRLIRLASSDAADNYTQQIGVHGIRLTYTRLLRQQ